MSLCEAKGVLQCSAIGANAHTSKMYKTDFPADFVAVADQWGSHRNVLTL